MVRRGYDKIDSATRSPYAALLFPRAGRRPAISWFRHYRRAVSRSRIYGLLYLATWFGFAVAFTAIGPGHFAGSTNRRDPSASALRSDLRRQIEVLVRGRYEVPQDFSVRIEESIEENGCPLSFSAVVIKGSVSRPEYTADGQADVRISLPLISSATGFCYNPGDNSLRVSEGLQQVESMEYVVPGRLAEVADEYLAFQHGDPSYGSLPRRFMRFAYMSSVIVSTLGFGDIVPTSDLARFMIMTEVTLGVALAGLFISSVFSKR